VTSERRTDLANSGDPGLGDNHADNFIDTIRGKAKLNAPIEEGFVSTLLAQLGNIAAAHRAHAEDRSDQRPRHRRSRGHEALVA
jgi:hypothetical protein